MNPVIGINISESTKSCKLYFKSFKGTAGNSFLAFSIFLPSHMSVNCLENNLALYVSVEENKAVESKSDYSLYKHTKIVIVINCSASASSRSSLAAFNRSSL